MQKAIYSVSEAVHFLGIQSHVLRYWEEELCLPIGRNEMGHRYYTRWDIQVFLSIRELKKKGYALKEIGELTTLFYKNQAEKKQPEHRTATLSVSREFMEIISKLVTDRLQEKIPGKRGIKDWMSESAAASSTGGKRQRLWRRKGRKRNGFFRKNKTKRQESRKFLPLRIRFMIQNIIDVSVLCKS